MATKATPADDLLMDIDFRLAEIRREMFEGWATGYDTVEFVAALIRLAYGKGLTDALNDPAEARHFMQRHGHRVPRAKK